ncbi:MAG: Ig-like domain-containing protein [Pirellulaceae bacterium]|nr:Ig-like domain-containing protein [Pirellulaceae bacterium]
MVEGSVQLGGTVGANVGFEPIPWVKDGGVGSYIMVLSATGAMAGEMTGSGPDPASWPGLPTLPAGAKYEWKVVMENGGDSMAELSELSGAALPWSGNGTRDVVLVLWEVPAPEPHDDGYSIVAGQPLTVEGAGVLANDWWIWTDQMTAVLEASPSHGSVSLNLDGSFVYTPSAGFAGVDTFTYKTHGEHNGDMVSDEYATVTINVVNHAPVAGLDAYSVVAGSTLEVGAPGVLDNDTDQDWHALTAILVGSAANGTAAINADGSLVYTPYAGFAGVDTIYYQAFDGYSYSDVTSVIITVANGTPVGSSDGYTTPFETPLVGTAPGVLANDSDPDGHALTTVLVSGPTYGSLTFNSDGSFVYTPAAGMSGTDGFSYRAFDGYAYSNPVAVTIDVGSGNAPPVAGNDAYAIDSGYTLHMLPSGVLYNDSDPDNDPLIAVLVAGPAHGTLTLAADGSFYYTSDTGFVGEDTFTYLASDGTANSNVATVTIVVTEGPGGENQAPVAGDDGYQVDEDQTLNVTLPGVLANDTDEDGDPLSVSIVDPPDHGTLTLNADGSFSYVPDANFHGTDEFRYEVSDGDLTDEAIVAITVNSVNDPPIALDDEATVAMNQLLTLLAADLLQNDSDVEGDPLELLIVSGPSHGTLSYVSGQIIYTPNENYTGYDSFTYRATDGDDESNEATVEISVYAEF